MAKTGRPRKRNLTVELVEWVTENIAEPDVQEAESPSSQAWALLCWARNNKDKFFEKIFPRAIAAREDESRQEMDEEEEEALAQEDVLRLRRQLRPLLDGTNQLFCEKCWREIEPGQTGVHEVSHDSGKDPGEE